MIDYRSVGEELLAVMLVVMRWNFELSTRCRSVNRIVEMSLEIELKHFKPS